MKYKPELLAPAGDLQKLKVAILYGADAVFIGGKKFSLRAKASNFDILAIQEGVIFAHQHDAKVYVTVNMYPHNEDFEGLDAYLLALDAIKVDAIIVSSLAIVQRAKYLKCRYELHLSTQQSVANQHAVTFWEKQGVDRIVLARELSVDEITQLKRNVATKLEVFIHGGMCSSFSGRCTLSNNMANRDANRGGCAHSCRWYYDLYQNEQLVSTHDFQMGSKDLMAFPALVSLLEARVDSFKIEGRMKSLHYIATVVSAYRQFIDRYLSNQTMDEEQVKKHEKMVQRAENRAASTGFLLHEVNNEGTLFGNTLEKPPQDFIGLVMEHEQQEQIVKIQQRNYFEANDQLEVLEPSGFIFETTIQQLYDENKQPIQVARHAMQVLYLVLDKTPPPYSMLRKKQGF